jgi:2-oxoglutarate ferredoxin oxidoreductase subunit beta
MRKIFSRPQSLTSAPFRYCPGCGHSTIHRLIAECVDVLNVCDRIVGIAPVGCAVFAYDYFSFDILEAAHGRPPAVATALKRVMPDRIIFSYQGDGDLAAIGTSEIIHAANRGENISVFFVNNATYGMTGGQMAPTTIPRQRTTTTPGGRNIASEGQKFVDIKTGNRKSFPLSGRGKGVQLRGDPLPLSYRLGTDAEGLARVDEDGDASGVSSGRV